MMYDQIIRDLRQAYDQKVKERSKKEIAGWKVDERKQFLTLLQKENKWKSLEIGASCAIVVLDRSTTSFSVDIDLASGKILWE